MYAKQVWGGKVCIVSGNIWKVTEATVWLHAPRISSWEAAYFCSISSLGVRHAAPCSLHEGWWGKSRLSGPRSWPSVIAYTRCQRRAAANLLFAALYWHQWICFQVENVPGAVTRHEEGHRVPGSEFRLRCAEQLATLPPIHGLGLVSIIKANCT